MGAGQIVLALYAALMLVGGLFGYRAGSRVSLVAGSASAAALVVALLISLARPAPGLWIGAAIALALCGVFGRRMASTGKMMPAGVLAAASALALVLLTLFALRV